MYKKRWFSFLEMLIVIMIVGILFVAFRSSFEIKNKDTLYGQSCIETIYGQVNNFLHAGLSSKSVNSWSTQIFPDTYNIIFSPDQQRIELQYEEQWSTHIYSSIAITGNTDISYCSSNKYTIQITWDTYELYINKWLQENADLKFFYISGTNVANTGANIFLQCDTQGTGCKTMARFESDTRTVSIKKQMCLTFTWAGECFERDN